MDNLGVGPEDTVERRKDLRQKGGAANKDDISRRGFRPTVLPEHMPKQPRKKWVRGRHVHLGAIAAPDDRTQSIR
jgi:hypothetical protein